MYMSKANILCFNMSSVKLFTTLAKLDCFRGRLVKFGKQI